jgi:hypothetical protein
MVRRALPLLAALAAGTCGCDVLFPKGNVDGGGGGAPLDAAVIDSGPDMAHPVGGDLPASAAVYRIIAGANADVPSGAPVAYAITYSGGAYRLEWIGSGAPIGDHFSGSIWTRGSFTTITPGCSGHCEFSSGDWLSQPTAVASGGQRLDFDTLAPQSTTGLDFVVDTEPVYFQLLVAGQPSPGATWYPDTDFGVTRNPGEMPFGLSTQ